MMDKELIKKILFEQTQFYKKESKQDYRMFLNSRQKSPLRLIK